MRTQQSTTTTWSIPNRFRDRYRSISCRRSCGVAVCKVWATTTTITTTTTSTTTYLSRFWSNLIEYLDVHHLLSLVSRGTRSINHVRVFLEYLRVRQHTAEVRGAWLSFLGCRLINKPTINVMGRGRNLMMITTMSVMLVWILLLVLCDASQADGINVPMARGQIMLVDGHVVDISPGKWWIEACALSTDRDKPTGLWWFNRGVATFP